MDRVLVWLLLAAALPGCPAQFVRPQTEGGPLVYGVKGGIHLALHPFGLDARPAGGPRGLIRVGFEEAGRLCLLNYIAIEPVVGAFQGFSELEPGGDGERGKRCWLGKGLEDGAVGRHGDVRGALAEGSEGRRLVLVLHMEPFANGAAPVIEAAFFERQPDRIRLRCFSGPGGKEMARCTLSATMGNQSRCRHLWLAKGAAYAPKLYAGYTGVGFVEKPPFGCAELFRTKQGDLVAALAPDEFEPSEVWPLPTPAWRHEGKWMAQFWLKRPGTDDSSLQCRVNGRRTYWPAAVPIPGGLSFENFELRERFRPGQESWFGFTARSPAEAFGFAYDVSPRATPLRTIPEQEARHAAEAAAARRPLGGADFPEGFEGWKTEGGAQGFRVFLESGARALTTFGREGDAQTGRLYQCFRVPEKALELRLLLHGGADRERLYVALWQGPRLHRRMTGRDSNSPFRVHWDVRALRGTVATLEIVDQSVRPWGFLGLHGLALVQEE